MSLSALGRGRGCGCVWVSGAWGWRKGGRRDGGRWGVVGAAAESRPGGAEPRIAERVRVAGGLQLGGIGGDAGEPA